MAEVIRFEYAVYLTQGHLPAAQALKRCNRLVRTRYKGLTLVDKVPDQPAQIHDPLVSIRWEPEIQKNYAPPTIESLQYRGEGLSADQRRILQRSRDAIILEFAHPKEHVWSSLRAATELMEELARQTGGFIWDEETRQVFTPEEWHKKRLADWNGTVPALATQFTIDLYPNGEYARAVTLGMAKFGLPDLVVQEFPQSSSTQAQSLINLFAQSLAEGADLPATGKFKIDIRALKNDQLRNAELKSQNEHALGIACVFLKPGKPDEGDPKNRLLELSAGLYSGPDPQAKQDHMFYSLFGSEDVAHNVEHTRELLEESRRERAKLPALHKALNAGLQPGEYIDVKAPFPKSGGGDEWMWVEVTSWKGRTITGTLQSDPVYVQNLHGGQVVKVSEDDVFDYLRTYPDKHTEGNTTAKILERTESLPEKPADHAEMPDCGSR
jgi:uncharacterized protein YegJ (DUF2314 family)